MRAEARCEWVTVLLLETVSILGLCLTFLLCLTVSAFAEVETFYRGPYTSTSKSQGIYAVHSAAIKPRSKSEGTAPTAGPRFIRACP